MIFLRLIEKPVTCRITERTADDLFFSMYNSDGDEVKLTVIDPHGNEVYLTGAR